MRKLNAFFSKTKSVFTGQKELWILLGISAIIFVAAVSFNYVFGYVTGFSANENCIDSFEYIYSNGPSNSYSGEWNTASKHIPNEKYGKYLHVRFKIDAASKKRTLVLNTDHSPVRILLNGKEVYNNHYSESEYVGNEYNAVVIPESNSQTLAEISFGLPFSANISAKIINGGDNSAFRLNTAVILSAAVILLGIVLLIIAAVISLAKKQNNHAVLLFAMIIVYGIAALTFAMQTGTYLINFPRFYNLALTLANTFAAISLTAAAVILKIKDKRTVLAISAYFVLSLCILLPQSVLLVKILSVLALISAVAAAFFAASICRSLIAEQKNYAEFGFVLLAYTAMTNILSALRLIFDANADYRFYQLFGGAIAICFVVYAAVSERKNARNVKQIEHSFDIYYVCAQKLGGIINKVLAAENESEFCGIAAGAISEFAADCISETEPQKIAFAAAVKRDGEYNEVCSAGLSEPVDFNMIESRFKANKLFCEFAQSYFDFVIISDESPRIILHFENISGGLSPFFTDMLSAAYICINAAYNRYSETGAATQIIEDTLIDIAKNAKHNSDVDLDRIAKCTKIILSDMGYAEQICADVSKAAMLCDIGRLLLPCSVRQKEEPLADSERIIIKKHTDLGYRFMSAVDGDFAKTAATIAYQHHERYDGHGYIGLNNDETDAFAKVVALAAEFDDMMSKQPQNKQNRLEKSAEYIFSKSEKAFDPKIVEAFRNCLEKTAEIYEELAQ